MRKLPQISDAEFRVMKVIWQHAPISTNEVVDRLNGESSWSPKTIHTLLARLVKKGALSYEKESRAFVYTPLVKEEEYLEHESESFLNKFYGGTLNSMVISFLKQDKLSDADISELQMLIDKRRPKGGR